MTGTEFLFGLIAVPVLVGALGAVRSSSVVHAAWWLVLALGSLAGLYVLLGAEVVALMQLLVYVGAVVVLLLFALMLTRAPLGPHADLDISQRRQVGAAVAGVATTLALGTLLLSTLGELRLAPDPVRGQASSIGAAIFTGWVLPFELLSVLLLAALVGAVAVARGRRGSAAARR